METNFRGDKKIGVHQIKCQEGDMMSKTVFYKDAKGSEVATSLKEIPANALTVILFILQKILESMTI